MCSLLESVSAKKGYRDQIKTFPDEKLAKQWLAEQERNALLGIHFPKVRASEHTLSDKSGALTETQELYLNYWTEFTSIASGLKGLKPHSFSLSLMGINYLDYIIVFRIRVYNQAKRDGKEPMKRILIHSK